MSGTHKMTGVSKGEVVLFYAENSVPTPSKRHKHKFRFDGHCKCGHFKGK